MATTPGFRLETDNTKQFLDHSALAAATERAAAAAARLSTRPTLYRGVLNAMREMEALCQVLRAFDNPAEGDDPDPLRELRDLLTETVLADLEVAEKRTERLRKDRSSPNELKLMERIVEVLGAYRCQQVGGFSRRPKLSRHRLSSEASCASACGSDTMLAPSET